MQKEYQVRVDYDNDAGVWIATSDDIVGLVLEDESPEYLMKRVTEAAPELIRLNSNVTLHLSVAPNRVDCSELIAALIRNAAHC